MCPSSLPTGCEKNENDKRDGENKNITEKRNGSLSRQRKTLYRNLGRAALLTFKFFTDTIEKIMKIFKE